MVKYHSRIMESAVFQLFVFSMKDIFYEKTFVPNHKIRRLEDLSV